MQCVLTIAGSDSGGNAGVQADLRTFHAYGLHGCTAFSALTAQNPAGVYAIHPLPAAFVAAQLNAVLGTYDIAALKTGMLGDPDVIAAIAEKLRAYPAIAKVIDPVMVATSGARLISESAIEALKRDLFPLATLITPNLPEAETLLNRRISTQADAQMAAQSLAEQFGCAVLLKGGHALADSELATDILFDGDSFAIFTAPKIEHPVSTHGTGCTLSAAIAAELTRGASLHAAIEGAKRYVTHAIADSYWVGPDCGVLAL